MRNNSSATLFLLVAVVLAGGGLYLASGGGDNVSATSLGDSQEEPLSSEAASASPPGNLPQAAHAREASAPSNSRPAEPGAAALAEPQSERVNVALAEESEDLIVLVQDSNGRPLENLWVWVSSTPNGRFPFSDDRFRVRSDAEGRIRFEGVRSSLRPDRDYYLVHDVAFESLPHTLITPSTLELPVLLTIQPDYGSIEVSVVDYDGEPARQLESVALQLISPDEERDASLAFTRQSFDGTPAGNRCLFLYVELGRNWGVRAVRGAGFDTQATSEGPRALAATTKIEARFGSDRPVLLMRAVNKRGAAMPGVRLSLSMLTLFGPQKNQIAMTDARGEFAAHFGLEGAGIVGGTLRASYTGDDGVTYLGKFAELGDLENGENHRGDLVLHAAADIVHGRVVDVVGAPLSGVFVRAGLSPDYEFGSQSRIDFIETRTDADGEFVIRGHEDWEDFKVWAFYSDGPWGTKVSTVPEGLQDARSSVLDARRGSAALVLVLGNLVQPHVEMLLPKGAKAKHVELVLIPDGRPEERKSVKQNSNDLSSALVTCSFDLLEPGNYTLQCTLRSEDALLLEVRDQWIEADGLLTRVDLRDTMFVHTIHLLRDSGERLDGSYCYREAGSEDDWTCDNFEGSDVHIATSLERIDVRVLPSAFQGEVWLGLKGEASMLLRAPYRIRLVLRTNGKMPTPPYLFSARPHFDGREVGGLVGPRSFTDSLREMVYDVPMAGKHSIHWQYEQRGDSFGIMGGVLGGREVEIEVRDISGEQVFELQLDGEALTQLANNPPWD